jgi:RNA polymerase sigma-70 factor (ECF subfamily)
MSSSPSEPCTESIDLVRRAQDGDRQALDELFGRYYGRVRRNVRSRLGPHLRNFLESGDILQETFAAAVNAFDRFEMRDEASLIHWLSRIAQHQINAAADYHTALKRDRRRDVALHVRRTPEESSILLEPEAAPEDPLDELVHDEDVGHVERCLAELRPEYRTAIVEHDYHGCSWDELARRLGSPTPNAARMVYARAVAELTRLVRKGR